MIERESRAEIIASIRTMRVSHASKFRNLGKLYVECLDADDMSGVELCLETANQILRDDDKPSAGAQTLLRYMSRPARAMYGGGRHIVVEHAKHGEEYYSANTPHELASAYLSILWDRYQQGCYDDGGFWDGDAEVNEMTTMYLDRCLSSSELRSGVSRTSDIYNNGTVSRWKDSKEVSGIRENLKPGHIWKRLGQEIVSDKKDLFAIAFLSWMMFQFGSDESFSADLRKKLAEERFDGTIVEKVREKISASFKDNVESVFALAASGQYRRAGRMAMSLIEDRCDYQYQRVELEPVHVAEFDTGEYLKTIEDDGSEEE